MRAPFDAASTQRGTAVVGLGKAGLLRRDGDQSRRVITGKPFGTDLAPARARRACPRHRRRIADIPHRPFLGDETVRTITVLRVATVICEPIWNRDRIDHVRITVAEAVGVVTCDFYDGAGAIGCITRC